MRVTAIWRYPLKSIAGERLSVAEITGTGLAGDRVVQVCDRHGRIATARTFPRLLQLRATLSTDGEPLVDGLPWDSFDVGRRVEAAVRLGSRLARFEGPVRFDILPSVSAIAPAARAIQKRICRFDMCIDDLCRPGLQMARIRRR